ncbi:MAG: RNA polymerase sigma factor, partial [Acidobacteriota bacterium]|nr:RNA polymerase sigma factor [Acidobacteriota bacterium]
MRQQRRQRGVEHRVDGDDDGHEEDEAAHSTDAIYPGPVTIGRRRAVQGGVNAATPSLDAPRLGARASFPDVVAEQLDAVYGYLVYLTGDRTAAEDLAAETFEKAFRTWRRFDPRRSSPRTWLCSIAHNVAIDWFRSEARRRRREETYSRDVEVAGELGDGLPGPMEEALRELSPAER